MKLVCDLIYFDFILLIRSDLLEIQPGRHTFNFMFEVPPDAPSSVNEEYGSIHYRIRVVFDRPWNIDLEFTSNFVVIRPLDFNSNPQLKAPLQEEEIKNFCCWFCASDKVIFTVTIPQSGFFVGQKIPLHITINNPSSVNITHVQMRLKKLIEYNCQTPLSESKHEGAQVHEMSHGKLFSNGKEEYNVDFEIPDTVASTNNPLVSVINIKYKLSVIAEVSSCPNLNYKIKLLIFLTGRRMSH